MSFKLPTVREVLKKRDGYDDHTIDNMLREFNEELQFGIETGDLEYCEQLLADHFGLEPDYLFADPEINI
jgi:hypothetical protein